MTRKFGTVHRYTVPKAQQAWDALPRIIAMLDEPVAGPGVIPQYLLSADIRASGIPVVNGGQGGDEMFAGYKRHLLPYALAEIRRDGGLRNASSAVQTLGVRGLLRVAAERALVPGTMLLHRSMRKYAGAFRHDIDFDGLMRADLTGYLGSLLHVEDRTSMAWSVESRVPLLDDAVIEMSASMHRSWKMRDGVPKRVLRDALRGLVPDIVLDRTDKRGLPTPLGQWLRGPWRAAVRDVLNETVPKTEDLFDRALLRRAFTLHCDYDIDLSGLLWRPLTTLLWFDQLGSKTAASTQNAPHAGANFITSESDRSNATRSVASAAPFAGSR